LIQYLHHEQIDKQLWDNAISKSSNGLVYAYSWYLDVVCKNWEALVLGNYEAIMPLTSKKKFTINYLYNPFFVQQLGVFSNMKTDAILVQTFINSIPEKFKFIEINLNSANEIELKKGKVSPNQNFELNLLHSYEYLKNRYSGNNKRNLKKALTFKLQILENIQTKKIIDLFKHDKGATVKNLKKPQYTMLENLIGVAEKHTKVLKFGVANEKNKLIAGAVFIFTNSKITFLFSGNSSEGKQKAAMFFVIDNIIKTFSNQNLILDFEGSNQTGLANFYKSFGSINSPYQTVKINRLPKPIKWLK